MRQFVTACALVVVVAACGGSDDRPSTEAWSSDWIETRDLLPGEAAIAEGGEEVCGDMLGHVRAQREELLPAPSQALDDLVDEWVALVEGLGLDCPEDGDELAQRLATVDALTQEIDDLSGAAP